MTTYRSNNDHSLTLTCTDEYGDREIEFRSHRPLAGHTSYVQAYGSGVPHGSAQPCHGGGWRGGTIERHHNETLLACLRRCGWLRGARRTATVAS